jgi:hypothetical protein
MGGLGVQIDRDLRVPPGEALLIIADIMHRHAGEMGEMLGGEGIRPAHLAGENDAVGRHQRLAGDAGIRVRRQIGVHHGIGDPVGNLVGMPLGDGFGGEQKLSTIAHAKPPCDGMPRADSPAAGGVRMAH